jgi:hypothetical protein
LILYRIDGTDIPVLDNSIEICEECNCEIYCNRAGIYILTKDDEDMAMCQWCFDDLWKEYYQMGWSCHDIENCLEAEAEADAEANVDKKEEEK